MKLKELKKILNNYPESMDNFEVSVDSNIDIERYTPVPVTYIKVWKDEQVIILLR